MNFVDKDGTTKVYISVHPCEIALFLNEVWGRGAFDEKFERDPHYPPHLRW